ncbi:16S rRNA (guanine(966)-N(2))-methyltransferase RsmD [Buchnera aphidicola (Mindarus keteleerifoliae)]|uniref:16S rRNA (guanine(966)-N(2))-methyltransferase RsmD n=1 Tax=Buchnera aphidicola TaxID=9 RepID=UPI0031B67636
MKKNTQRKIKIIGGFLKNKILNVKNSLHNRPTTNKKRETLFEWLKHDIKNSNCLDCFAGTGALGIESISRGAKKSLLLEINKLIIPYLYKNISNVPNIFIINTNALLWLKKKGNPFDIIFLDPPFKLNLLQKTIFLLKKNNWIRNSSIIYIEKSKKFNTLNIPKNWMLKKYAENKKNEYFLYVKK